MALHKVVIIPQISVQLETAITASFRVAQVAGMFDVDVGEKSRLELQVHVPPESGRGSEWRIGAIVGPSGGGKSTVARKAYGERFIERTEWPAGKAIVDCFPAELSMKDITAVLNAVGFSTPPAWILPYACLSTGQRMRCDLARALLRPEPVLAFDEFTSVVDRQVGKFASAAVAKAVRERRVPLERFVAVSCHYDVLDWLEPDWVLDMAERRLIVQNKAMTGGDLPRGRLCRFESGRWKRPAITLQVERVAGKDYWPLFHRHHYLSANIHPAARCYVAAWEGSPVAFVATLPNAGHVGRRIVHRLVTLPDYQGMGIGLRLLDAICQREAGEGWLMSIRTSHPALMASLRKRRGWRVGVVSRGGTDHKGFSEDEGRKIGSRGRTVASFEWRPRSSRKEIPKDGTNHCDKPANTMPSGPEVDYSLKQNGPFRLPFASHANALLRELSK